MVAYTNTFITSYYFSSRLFLGAIAARVRNERLANVAA